jgi:hypothetical protein
MPGQPRPPSTPGGPGLAPLAGLAAVACCAGPLLLAGLTAAAIAWLSGAALGIAALAALAGLLLLPRRRTTQPAARTPNLTRQGDAMDNPTNHQPPVRPVVDVLYIQGCPNYTGAVALVERVSNELGIDAQVRLQQISNPEAAIRARFLGSPTIRVDGRDIQPGAERQQEYVHGCRLYRVGHSLRGLPDEHWLRQALRAAEARP